jgi:uroporphyrin-III C-methyltransferase
MKDTLARKVWFIGAGPGAADLLTVRAIRILSQADVVLHDALLSDEMLEWAPQAQHVAVGKRCGQPSLSQPEIDCLLVAHAREHRVVVRLKGGDPAVFGRLDEEIEALDAAGLAWEMVPGVTAASAAAAAAGHSLTRREIARHLTIATPRVARDGRMAEGWAKALDPAGTAVLYMAGGLAAQSARALKARGFAAQTPVIAVRAASWPDQQIERMSLDDLDRTGLAPDPRPVVLLVGQALSARSLPASNGLRPSNLAPQMFRGRLQSANTPATVAARSLENPCRSEESPVSSAQPVPT